MMRLKTSLYSSVAAIGIAGLLAAAPAQLSAQTAVAIDDDDIGGVVTGPNGPEAGVWVIAETTDLPTRYAKIVVTDDQGRYVVPDLPKANYEVWVRGYGLVDSPKVDGEPGKQLEPDGGAGAERGGGGAVLSGDLLVLDDEDPGRRASSAARATFPEKVNQSDWLNGMKNNGCVGCHQLGQLSTRTIPAAFGEFKSDEEAWMRRIQSGQAGELMINPLAGISRRRAVQVFRRLDRPRRQGRAAARASRRGRRASSATSWSRLGLGQRRSNICTT